MVRYPDPRRHLSVRGEDLLTPLGQQPAVDDRDRVRDLLYLSEDVAGDEHLSFPWPGSTHRADLVNAGWIEAIGRLVEDQQVRIFE